MDVKKWDLFHQNCSCFVILILILKSQQNAVIQFIIYFILRYIAIIFRFSLKSGRSNRYFDRYHDFSVSILRCYKDVYVNSLFPRRARIWSSLSVECFPLIYDLISFSHHLSLDSFKTIFHVCCFLFLVTSCFVNAAQPSMEWILIKKENHFF